METSAPQDFRIISYLTLRKLIGAFGIVLPALCIIYGILYHFEDSISDYYGTPLRNVFEGILFVLGFFLLAYRGYQTKKDTFATKDNKFANCGFLFALGVALFPCNSFHDWVWITHFVSAFLLFCVFIYFSLILFPLSVKRVEPAQITYERILRKKVYIICGWIMVGCIVLIGLSYLTGIQRSVWHPIFWFESIALFAFAISWLTKGHAIVDSKEFFGKIRTLSVKKST